MKFLKLIIITLIILFSYHQATAYELPQPLVDVEWLSENLEKVYILDIRKTKDSYSSEPIYETDKNSGTNSLIKVGGHIPGSNFILYKNIRGEQSINGLTIKHMLLNKNKFENLMQQAGLNQDSLIVVTSNAENEYDVMMAARVYWQFKYFGHENISLLNGGTAQWLVTGNGIATTATNPSVGNWRAQKERKELLADSNEVSSAIDSSIQLIDFRPLGQYLGVYKSSKVSGKGHISGAKLYPVELIVSRKLPVRFLSPAELQNSSNALGIKVGAESMTYCNSGHMAAGGWFMMSEILGNENVKLYDGSMHQWTAEKRSLVKMKME